MTRLLPSYTLYFGPSSILHTVGQFAQIESVAHLFRQLGQLPLLLVASVGCATDDIVVRVIAIQRIAGILRPQDQIIQRNVLHLLASHGPIFFSPNGFAMSSPSRQCMWAAALPSVSEKIISSFAVRRAEALYCKGNRPPYRSPYSSRINAVSS